MLATAAMFPPQNRYTQPRRPAYQEPVHDHHQVVIHAYVLLVAGRVGADLGGSRQCILPRPIFEPLQPAKLPVVIELLKDECGGQFAREGAGFRSRAH